MESSGSLPDIVHEEGYVSIHSDQSTVYEYGRPGEADFRYRAFFESIDHAMCIIEVIFDSEAGPIDYRFLEVNPGFESHTGLSDVVGRTARELVPDLDTSWFEIYGEVVRTGEATRFENHAAGLQRWFDVHAFRLGPAEQCRLAVSFSDITTRVLRERNAEFLVGISRDLALLSKEDEIMNLAGDKLRKHLNLFRLSFAEMDDINEANVFFDMHDEGLRSGRGRFRMSDFMTSRALEELEAGQVVAIDDVHEDPRTAP
ncbi:MAG: PAS domain-containing protein, partial [Bradymonadaceae bacterium]